jgi:c-di-AMP phosphodiesterase-like protein
MKVIIKKIVGVILIIVGLFALLTPFTPGSWLALIGLELLGIRKFIFRKFLNDRQRATAEKFMEKLNSKFKRRHKDKPEEKKPQ